MTAVEVLACVKSALIAAMEKPDLSPKDISESTNMVLDLGMTSLTLVDLTMELENGLSIDEFPLQSFLDAEVALGEQGFKVGALSEFCCTLVGATPA